MIALRPALVLLLCGAPLAAQVPGLPAGTTPVRFTGQLGSFGEVYRRTGAGGQRPGETGRLQLDASATLFGSVRLGVNLLASTEDGAAQGFGALPGRQRISQFGLHPEWSWGQASIGTFTWTYTRLTYGAVPLTGAAFDLVRGGFQLGAFGGRATTATAGGISTGGYRRSVLGGRIGIGRQVAWEPSSFFNVVVVRAWDDPRSLAGVDTTLPPNAPVMGGTVPVNPYSVTPEENLVVAGVGGLRLLGGRLAWRGEVAAAAHTRDRRATPLNDAEVDLPEVVRGLMTPRVGTHLDYAFSTEVQLRNINLPGARPASPRALTASLGYRQVGPGYISLAAGPLANDLRALEGQATVRFARWTARLQGAQQVDNLLGQKLATTDRLQLGGSVSVRASSAWTAVVRANQLTMGNGSVDSTTWMDYRAQSFGTSHAFSLGPRRLVESLSLDYAWQGASDANPLRKATGFSSHNASARVTIRLASALQLSPTAGLARFRRGEDPAATRATYGMGAAWRTWGGRLATNGSLARTRYSRSQTWTGTLGSRFQVTREDDLLLQVQFNRFHDLAVPDSRYREQVVRMQWIRRF
jgi:hypothetical protein